jgi:hypothetical protein
MWKALVFGLLIPLNLIAAEESPHLQKLKNLFPNALLTDDFGILSTDDVENNHCSVAPPPFSNTAFGYSYWQCFDVNEVKMNCEGRKYSRESRSRMTMLVLSGETSQKNNSRFAFLAVLYLQIRTKMERKHWFGFLIGIKQKRAVTLTFRMPALRKIVSFVQSRTLTLAPPKYLQILPEVSVPFR